MGYSKIKKIFLFSLLFFLPFSASASGLIVTPSTVYINNFYNTDFTINGTVDNDYILCLNSPNGVQISTFENGDFPQVLSGLVWSQGNELQLPIIGNYTYDTFPLTEGCPTDNRIYTNTAFSITIGGLFNGGSATALVASIGIVSGSVFNGALPYFLLSIGVFIAFYILQQLIMIQPKPEKSKKDRIIRDKGGKQIGIDVTNDGYHRITGKKGQEIGWEKD